MMYPPQNPQIWWLIVSPPFCFYRISRPCRPHRIPLPHPLESRLFEACYVRRHTWPCAVLLTYSAYILLGAEFRQCSLPFMSPPLSLGPFLSPYLFRASMSNDDIQPWDIHLTAHQHIYIREIQIPVKGRYGSLQPSSYRTLLYQPEITRSH